MSGMNNKIETEMLFDNIGRTYLGIKSYADSRFEYLNLSARPSVRRIRSLLEDWYSDYPLDYRNELKIRFCSKNDLDHISAFFELFLHALFLNLGFEIEVHPDIPGQTTHPDFLVLKEKEPLFFLEATRAASPKEETADEKRKNVVYDTINKMDSPNFFLEVKVNSSSEKSPPGKKWRSQLKKWLSGLNPDEIGKILNLKGLDGLKGKRLEDVGWSVTFKPIPKSPLTRGKPGVRPLGIIWLNFRELKEHEWVKNSIRKKAGKYGNLNLPYIIAVNLISIFSQDSIIENALFGREGSYGNNEMTRDFDGAFCQPSGPQYTRVSAAMVFGYLHCGGIAKSKPVIWHNPWASNPLDQELLPFSQEILILSKDMFQKKEGRNIADIFGLPANWPFKEGENDFVSDS
jgi:hypothetical protein